MESLQKRYSCFIVDDNHLDRLTTRSFVRENPFLQITGEFEHAERALEAAGQAMPEVIFLDMDMPGMTGLELRERLQQVPVCIFITAFPDYALPAFEVSALDFLVKPLNAERFGRSMTRLRQFLYIRERAASIQHSLNDDSLFIKEGREQVKIHLGDIIYLEALKDYTGVVTRDRKYCVLSPLGNLLMEKSFQPFIRIHRSYAVPKSLVQKFNSREIRIGETVLPVGRMYKDSLNAFLTPDS